MHKLTFILLGTLLLIPFVWADEEAAEEQKTVASLTEGMQLSEGLIQIYQKEQTTYGLISSDVQSQRFLLAVGMSRGPLTGVLWHEVAVEFKLRAAQKQLLLVEPETRYRANPGAPIATAVERTYPPRLIAVLPVLALDGQDALIDMTELFAGDLLGVLADFATTSGEANILESVKTFPENVEVGAGITLMNGSERHMVRLHYSLRKIPETSYEPRAADPRVGYFISVARDYSTRHEARTLFQRQIQRWHLEKADPDLAVSPPVRPIVWYIEKTTPFRYRRHIRDGILEWNKAFEALGLSDVMVVRQQIEGGDFDDIAPEDARYNFFRWGTTDSGFAFGPSRVNPATGEILNAAVYFDDSLLRYNIDSYRKLGALASQNLGDRQFQHLLERDPFWQRRFGEIQPSNARLPRFHARCCQRGREGAHQLALAALALSRSRALGELPEPFTGQVLKEYVMHEIGHTLGLAHNFKASAWRDLAEISGNERIGDISASVMDYNAVNFRQASEQAPNYQMTTIGPYDYWAIRYGYTLDKEELPKLLEQSTQPQHAFASDDDNSFLDPDPLARPWDLGRDPLAYARRQIALVRQLLPRVLETGVTDGESYAELRSAVMTLLSEHAWACRHAASVVGGAQLYRLHKSNDQEREPIVPIPVAEQRAALELVCAELFDPGALVLDAKVLRHLAPQRWNHWASDQFDDREEFSLPRFIGDLQLLALFQLFNVRTQQRIESMPLLVGAGEDVLTCAELFSTVNDRIWSELAQAEAATTIALLRRNLQRTHLDMLIFFTLEASTETPGDVPPLASSELRRLRERIDIRTARGNLDAVSLAHLRESSDRAAAALEARYRR
jgi:hypothetical protein